jgi:hypothetical protein
LPCCASDRIVAAAAVIGRDDQRSLAPGQRIRLDGRDEPADLDVGIRNRLAILDAAPIVAMPGRVR